MKMLTVNEAELGAIAKRSLRNCHAMGLDSIMFDDTPEARIRCFIAAPEHDMFRNCAGSKLSVALHSHHCDVVLSPIFGDTYNISTIGCIGRMPYKAYKYQSQVTTGKGAFARYGDGGYDLGVRLEHTRLVRPLALNAADIHTIFVPWGKPAAWWVHEGKENPNYDGLAYSNDDLEAFDFSPLYQPMSVAYLRELLTKLPVKIAA